MLPGTGQNGSSCHMKFTRVQCKSNTKAMQVQFRPIEVGLVSYLLLIYNGFMQSRYKAIIISARSLKNMPLRAMYMYPNKQNALSFCPGRCFMCYSC
jgi:hypothetical protein